MATSTPPMPVHRTLGWTAVGLSALVLLGAAYSFLAELESPDPWPAMAAIFAVGAAIPALPGLLAGVVTLTTSFEKPRNALVAGIVAVALAGVPVVAYATLLALGY